MYDYEEPEQHIMVCLLCRWQFVAKNGLVAGGRHCVCICETLFAQVHVEEPTQHLLVCLLYTQQVLVCCDETVLCVCESVWRLVAKNL
jgi:hypothetical protein